MADNSFIFSAGAQGQPAIVTPSHVGGVVKKDDGGVEGVVIPDEAKQKYPDLVALILKSESMNVEEKNYWLQVLPVMTPDQVAELRDILETEKKKLAAIDQKYSSPGKGTPDSQVPQIDPAEVEKKRREAREKRLAAEAEHKEQDEETAEDLLAQLEAI